MHASCSDEVIKVGQKEVLVIDEAPRHRRFPARKYIAQFLKQVPQDHLTGLDSIIVLDEAPGYDENKRGGVIIVPRTRALAQP